MLTDCPADVTLVADPVTLKGTFQFNINGNGHQLQLPIGKHPYKFRSENGALCTQHVIVLGNVHLNSIVLKIPEKIIYFLQAISCMCVWNM